MPATALANVRSRQEWAEVINADWRKSIDSIIQTGRDLAAAKAELDSSNFLAMVDADLPFTSGTAEKLIRIANHPAINKMSTSTLPPSWAVLSELTKLSKADFTDAANRGLIDSNTDARRARAVAGAYRVPEGGTVGAGKSPAMLPTPSEARKIARETNRFVAASDGNIYSGASEEEGREYRDKRDSAFAILRAIETLSEAPEADDFFRTAERHWFVEFRPGAIDDARSWLTSFKEAMGVVDA